MYHFFRKILSILLSLFIYLSFLFVEPIHAQSPSKLEGYSILLNGEIGLNFHFHLSDIAQEDNTKVEFELPNRTKSTVYFKNAKKVNESYIFTCFIPAKSLTDSITVHFYSPNESLSEEYTYSVEEYANYIIHHDNSYSLKDIETVKSMMTYGRYTQEYFNYHTEKLPSISNPLHTVNLDWATPVLNKGFLGARLVLKSKVGLKLYFKENLDYYVDGTKVNTYQEGNYYVLEIPNDTNIYKMHEITSDSFYLKYGICSYGRSALQQNNNRLKNLILSLIEFHETLYPTNNDDSYISFVQDDGEQTFCIMSEDVSNFINTPEYTDDYSYSQCNLTHKSNASNCLPIKIRENGVKIEISNRNYSWEEEVEGNKSYRFYNVIPNQPYLYKVYDADNQLIQKGQVLGYGNTRIIQVPNILNIRDLGGWKANGGRIAYGKLYRGPSIRNNSQLNTSQNNLSVFSDQLLISKDVDFRNSTEVAGVDGIYGNEDDITYTDIPNAFYSRHELLEYIGLKPGSSNYISYVHALEEIINNVLHGDVTYFHCAAGADRTGSVAMLIEGLLGVSQSDIDKDYELTNIFTSRLRHQTKWKDAIDIILSIETNVENPTFEDHVIQWFLSSGFSVETLNAFRRTMINGNPKDIDETRYKDESFIKDGIYEEEGELYYYVNSARYYAGLIYLDTDEDDIPDTYYYVRTGGILARNGSYYVSKNNSLLRCRNYLFDENGRLVPGKNGIYREEDGFLYYYEYGEKTAAGLIYLDTNDDDIPDTYYYVRTSGILAQNEEYYITTTNGLLPAKKYQFDSEGRLILEDEEKTLEVN